MRTGPPWRGEAAGGLPRISPGRPIRRRSRTNGAPGRARLMPRRSKELERVFEGPEVLDALLELAGSDANTLEVMARMAMAQESGLSASEVIPNLFPKEPRFSDPEVARSLY